MTRDARYLRQIQSFYPAIGYHTWEHVSRVYETGHELLERLRQYRISVNGQQVRRAIYGHDAGNMIDPGTYSVRDLETDQCRTAYFSEEVSAEIARTCMERSGFGDAEGLAVARTILSTNPDIEPRTTEAKVLAAADLQIADDYRTFWRNGELLRKEAAMRQGVREIAVRTFYPASINYLARFLCRRIELTPRYYNEQGQSAFHVGAVANVLCLLDWLWRSSGDMRVVVEIGCGINPVVLNDEHRLSEHDVYIGIDTDHPLLPKALCRIENEYFARKLVRPVTLAIPAEQQAISLPDQSVDHLYMVNTWLRHWERQSPALDGELNRILRSGGRLEVRETYQSDGSATDSRSESQVRHQTVERLKRAGFEKVEALDVPEGWGVRMSRP